MYSGSVNSKASRSSAKKKRKNILNITLAIAQLYEENQMPAKFREFSQSNFGQNCLTCLYYSKGGDITGAQGSRRWSEECSQRSSSEPGMCDCGWLNSWIPPECGIPQLKGEIL